jgi:hemoglobin/transferrin/lactoferrin receptor protein
MAPFFLLFLSFCGILSADIVGRVIDVADRPVTNARVELRSVSGISIATVNSDEKGNFSWQGNSSGNLLLRVSSPGFQVQEVVAKATEMVVRLEPQSLYTNVVVTATRGGAEEAKDSAHVSLSLPRSEIEKRPLLTLGNALEGSPGILVQQTTTAQVSPFLRGLTGYQVLNLLDGIRFNNSTFRSGPNQYLAFVDPSQAQRVEAMLGPTGVQYGSDSLGGTIHVQSQAPEFAGTKQWEQHGQFGFAAASADLSGIASGRYSIASQKLFALVGASGRKHNDLRAGGGLDSRNVFHRFFGMSQESVRDLLGVRQQDSGFRQYGIETKLALRPSINQVLTVNYQRGGQDQVRGYKDLLGGLGRLISEFQPQTLNWLYGRYETLNRGIFDSVSGTVSLNQQIDGSRRQNLLATDAITTDDSTVNVYGYSGQALTHWTSKLQMAFGGDFYDEHINSTREVRNPVTGAVTRPRPLYPNGSRYGNLGMFGQANLQLHRKLRAAAGIRWTGVRFNDQRNQLWFRDTTFHTSLRWDWNQHFGLHGVASRGFRAPNLNDLGALGLNDLGYEIPASEAIPFGALLSTDAGEGATSKGVPLRSLLAESLMNYEFGMRVSTRKLYSRVQLFHAELQDPIVRRTLLFPAGSAPTLLGGQALTVLPQTAAQRTQGVVTVATAADPRAVKAFVNDGRSRYYGLEAQMRYLLPSKLSVEANYSYIVGRDLNPNRNIRRLPPQMGTVALRRAPGWRQLWGEVAVSASGVQDRLSGGDIDDERIGASLRRADIASFFRGSRVAPYLDNNGTVFRPTGETLVQIQNRVLPGVSDNTRVPLYRSTAGWVSVAVRAGLPLGERWQVLTAIENLLDRNYRIHGSGIDAPGINAYMKLSYRF